MNETAAKLKYEFESGGANQQDDDERSGQND